MRSALFGYFIDNVCEGEAKKFAYFLLRGSLLISRISHCIIKVIWSSASEFHLQTFSRV